MNTLYYGDNLTVLRNEIASESIDLIYLDPPFNSQSTYNVLFKSTSGEKSQAQIEAFGDTWHWGEQAENAFDEVMKGNNTYTAELLRALRAFLKENDVMAYICMMAVRLLELHRVLKPTGSIYLHCDPTASHYLKMVLDSVMGPGNFRNEVIWKRFSSHGNVHKAYGRVHDTILFYSLGDRWSWNQIYKPLSEKYVQSFFTHVEPATGRTYRLQNVLNPNKDRPNLTYEWNGHIRVWKWKREKMEKFDREGLLEYSKTGLIKGIRQYLDESPGEKLQDVWEDIRPLGQGDDIPLGYPTQKPLALLERIISASSKEGDIVLDPFCGCGTAVHAAQKLRRQWIGIDITHLAISLIEKRLNDAFPGIQYVVHGTPKDLEGARALAAQDKYQFQWWAVSLVNAVPFAGKKKGADSGIDGLIYFKPEGKTTEKAIVSVKGGDNVSVAMIRELSDVVESEKAKIGVFITLAEPTGPMKTKAVTAGLYETPYGKYQRIQIFTIADLFSGKQPNIPLIDPSAFKKAAKEGIGDQKQLPL